MAILYSVVARASVVLVECSSSTTSNANAVARQILEKVPEVRDSRVSFSQDRYIFHVLKADGLTFLCMANDVFGRRIPFSFLEDIHAKFMKQYGHTAQNALPYAMNDEFSRVLYQQMDFFSNDPNADQINRIKGEMNQVRTVMLENIDKVLERGDRLELLVDKTANIQNDTFRFKKQTRRFRTSVWWRNIKLMFALFILVLILIYVVLALACGGPTIPSCRK